MTKIYKKIMGWNAYKLTMSSAFLLSLGAFNLNAQTIYNEPFTNNLGTTTALNGLNGNWIFTNSCAQSSAGGHTGPGSALFQGQSCNYGNGSNQVAGDLNTPSVTIGPFGGILTFNYYLQNECGNGGNTCYYDVLSVNMSTNGGGSFTNLMASNTGTFTNVGSWTSVSYNLPANQNVIIQFDFNSLDGYDNAYDGVYVDDINITNIPSCTSSPANATIVPTTTLVCPIFGTSSFTNTTTYTLGGVSFAWFQSTGTVNGPYSAVPSATLQTFTTPTLNTTTWYKMVATCAFGGIATTLTPVEIQVANSTSNTVPYFEGFEGITQNKQLPNCSWFRSDNYQCGSRTASVSAWRQARTGTKFAEFDASDYVYYQTRYFYSNGILLNAGITYSASVWYNTPGYSTWNNLTLLYGPNQSPAGLVQLATIAYPGNTGYQPLSNTFQVNTTGMYYLSVKATEGGSSSQMVWDDLAIIAPCQFTNNAAAIALTGSTTICAGQSINLTAAGATSYTWNSGQNSNTINVAPPFTAIYSVTGINPLSGCLGSATKTVVVNQLPVISIISTKQQVCNGDPVTLLAIGAPSYTWSAGPSILPAITVTPTAANNTYTLLASSLAGCVTSAVQQVTVLPSPAVTVSGTTLICEGYSTSLVASGAGANGMYEWQSKNNYLQSDMVILTPNVTTAYTITATSNAGCKGTNVVIVEVDICTGIQNSAASDSKVSVYPNPNTGLFTVALKNGLNKVIEVVDVTGRIILSSTSTSDVSDINISNLANGVYYVKVKSGTTSEVVKVVKQ